MLQYASKRLFLFYCPPYPALSDPNLASGFSSVRFCAIPCHHAILFLPRFRGGPIDPLSGYGFPRYR